MNGNDVIEEVNRLLLSGQREELNKLSGAILDNTETITLKFDLGGIKAGALIDIDLETMRVWMIDESSKTATLQRGMNGTTATAHSDGALVYVNPRMSRAAIFKALNDEIRALSSVELYQMGEVEFNYSSVQSEYDLTGASFLNIIDVYDVRQKRIGADQRWMPLDNWRYAKNSDPDSFASGSSLFIPAGVPGQKVRVLVRAEFTPLGAGTDDIATVAGIPEEMQDILSMGVLMRLGPVREIKRNFTEVQGNARRADEVQTGAVQQSFASVRQMRADRIAQEQWRLANKYPKRHR